MDATAKALVLKVGRFREADVWVKLLTPTHGIFNAFAFGGSRSRRRFVGCLDPLSHVCFTLGSSKRGEYVVLQEGSLLHNFSNVKKKPTLTGVAANCIRFIEALEIDARESWYLYELLLHVLTMLEHATEVSELIPWLFRAKVAFGLGYEPDFLICGCCRKDILFDAGAFFHVESGQVLCHTCVSVGKPLDGFARPISTGALRALDWIQQSQPADWATLIMDPKVRRQASQLVEMFVAYHLGLSWDNGIYKKV